MSASLARRLMRIEAVVEAQRRPIRELVYRAISRLGGELPAVDVETIVTRHLGLSARIDRMRHAGVPDDQILARLLREIDAREAE